MIYTILYLIKKDIILFITEAKANETFKQYLTQQPRLLKRAEYISYDKLLWEGNNYGIIETVDKNENTISKQKVSLEELYDISQQIDKQLKERKNNIEISM